MAQNRVYTESVVTLNNAEANARLEETRAKAAQVRQEMARLAQEKGINSKEFKTAQKELIALEKSQKDLNEQTKRYQKIINDISGSSLNELQAAYRKTYQQMRKARPDSKEYEAAAKTVKQLRTRMKELEDQGRQSQKIFGGFFSKIGWAGIITGALALFRRFAKDMISQTQLIGDKWKFETAGWKDAYGAFIADISSGKGWNEMIQHMKDAYKNGKEVARMLDEIFERNNSLTLSEGQLSLAAEQQRKIMMDSTRSNEERLKAAQKYDEIQEEMALQRKDVARQEMEAYREQFATRTGMTNQEIDLFVREYNQHRTTIEQAREYQQEYSAMQAEVNRLQDKMLTSSGKTSKAYAEQYNAAQAALDEFSQNADRNVKKWADLLQKYNLGNDEMVQNYVTAYRKMQDADTGYERATQRSNRQAATLRKQMASEAASAANQAYQDEIKRSEERYKELQNAAKAAYATGEISEAEYQQRLTNLQEAGLKDRIAIGERHKQSVVDLTGQLLDLNIAEMEKVRKVLATDEAELAKLLQEEIDETIAAIDDALDEGLEDWIDDFNKLRDRAEQIREGLDPVGTLQKQMAAELQTLDEAHEANLLSEEEYQKARAEIIKRYAKETREIQAESIAAGIQSAQKYIGELDAFFSALQSAAEAQLEARMQAELTAAGENAEQREAIEEKYEQEKLELQKRYATVNMTIEIAKAVAAGALAIMQAWAELGPIGAPVMTALISATTAAQVAAIIAQRNAVLATTVSSSGSGSSEVGERTVAGFHDGGYTKRRSNDYDAVGVVHANEWVAPAAMVRANPITFATLESMRRSGRYRSGATGFADGGIVGGGAAAAPATVGDGNLALLQETHDLMQKILEALPFPTYVVLSEINAKQELQQTIKKIAGK